MVADRREGEPGNASCDIRKLKRTSGLSGLGSMPRDASLPVCPSRSGLQLPPVGSMRSCVCDADSCREGAGAGRSAVMSSVCEPLLIRGECSEAGCMADGAGLAPGAVGSAVNVPPTFTGDAAAEASGCVDT